MQNKLKPNSNQLNSPNELEIKNTMYYNVGTAVRWDERKATKNEARVYEERI